MSSNLNSLVMYTRLLGGALATGRFDRAREYVSEIGKGIDALSPKKEEELASEVSRSEVVYETPIDNWAIMRGNRKKYPCPVEGCGSTVFGSMGEREFCWKCGYKRKIGEEK